MSKGLDSIWILDSSGLCLMHRVFYSKNSMDETMFGGFIKAVLSFAEDTVEETIEKITFGGLDLYIQSFGNFYVIISTKKDCTIKNIEYSLVEVGESFRVQYDSVLKSSNLLDTELFEPFSDIIDQIFNIKTIRILKEHHELLEILRRAEEKQFSEEKTAKRIIQFYENLDADRRITLLKTTESILRIFKNSKSLYPDYRQKIADLLKMVKK